MAMLLDDSMYLENIREYVEDHKTIVNYFFYFHTCPLYDFLQVTYKWLSRELNVPVNAAKQ